MYIYDICVSPVGSPTYCSLVLSLAHLPFSHSSSSYLSHLLSLSFSLFFLSAIALSIQPSSSLFPVIPTYLSFLLETLSLSLSLSASSFSFPLSLPFHFLSSPFFLSLLSLSVAQEYASPALVQNKLESARIVPAFLVTANQTDVYAVGLKFHSNLYSTCTHLSQSLFMTFLLSLQDCRRCSAGLHHLHT